MLVLFPGSANISDKELTSLIYNEQESTPVRRNKMSQSDLIRPLGNWTQGRCRDVEVVGNNAYVGSGMNLQIMNVTDPRNPDLLSQKGVPGQVYGITVQGPFVYVSSPDFGFAIIDVSDSSQPSIIAVHDIANGAKDVFVEGDYAFRLDLDLTSGVLR